MMLQAAVKLPWTVIITANLRLCTNLRQLSTGVDNLRRVLQQLRSDVDIEARNTSNCVEGVRRSTALGRGVAAIPESAAGCREDKIKFLHSSATIIKELLRIFTRKVPGGLVPDGLVRGFIEAYRELTSPQDRLAFLTLITHEMGVSAGEVSSAVRLWDSMLARPSPTPDAGTTPTPVMSPSTEGVPGMETLTRLPMVMGTASGTVTATATAMAAGTGTGTGTAAPMPSGCGGSSASTASFDAVHRVADRISSACRPLYTQLFLPISQAPDGMKFLVDLRADLLQLVTDQQRQQEQEQKQEQKQQQHLDPGISLETPAALRAMAEHLRQSLAEWFSVGLLHLQPISWEESSAALLERVMRCEAVHPLDSWEELRRRLGPRRRVFAFTHPCMPGEPLVVLHTALLAKPAAAMSDILAEQSHEQMQEGEERQPRGTPHPAGPPLPSTAVFYSISTSQPGLRGIDLGQFLIKHVAERLMAEHPSIRRLVTLSPLPNYRAWLISRLRQEQAAAIALPPPPPPPPPFLGRMGTGSSVGSGNGNGSGNSSGSGSGSQVDHEPLLSSQEAGAVVQLAVAMGWTPGPQDTPGGMGGSKTDVHVGGSGGRGGNKREGEGTVAMDAETDPDPDAAQPRLAAAQAAAALCWLLEGDRWLSHGSHENHAPASPRCGVIRCDLVPGNATRPDPHGGLGMESELDEGIGRAGEPEAIQRVLRPLLMRLAARYLAVEKRRRFALCPVAHFHLRNGALMWRLNWRADMSPLGLSRSFGIMVNYEYDLPRVYDNNWKYIMQHEVQAHPQVLELL